MFDHTEHIARLLEQTEVFRQVNAELGDLEDQIYRLKQDAKPLESEATQEMLMEFTGKRSNEESRKAYVAQLLAENPRYTDLQQQIDSLLRQKMRTEHEKESVGVELKSLRGLFAFLGTVNERETAELQASVATKDAGAYASRMTHLHN